MIPRPPTSTLFPYTTLFRSEDVYYVRVAPSSVLTLLSAASRLTHAGAVDRKSTRMNSSHANISYAVFCLKKKTHHKSRLSLRSWEWCTWHGARWPPERGTE